MTATFQSGCEKVVSDFAGLVARGVSTLRRYGFRPTRIAASVAHQQQRKRRANRLRTTYMSEIANPSRPADLRPPPVDLPRLDQLPPELRAAAEALREEAVAVVDHRMDYLGSGLVDLGAEIDWHCDFKSGYRWPPTFYQDLEITRLDDDSDAKVPWELSRGHQLLTLARAARVYEDKRF